MLRLGGYPGELLPIITGLITLAIIAGYKSSEEYNLLASIAVHRDDLERINRKNEINYSELTRLKSEE